MILPDDLPTAPGSAAHLKVAAAATSSPVIRLYRPATVLFNVLRSGAPYTGSATVTLTSSRGTNTYTFAGGSYTVPTGLVSGLQYTASATAGAVTSSSVTQMVPDLSTYPANLTSTFTLVLPDRVTLNVPPTATAFTTIPASAITATFTGITGTGSSNPITFKVFPSPPADCTTGGTTIGTATGSGNGSFHPSSGATLAPGTWWWYVVWPGDSTHGTSASDCPPTATTTVSLGSPALAISAPTTATTGSTVPAANISAGLTNFLGQGSGSITFYVKQSPTAPTTNCGDASWTKVGATATNVSTSSPNTSYNPTANWSPTTAGTYWWYASLPATANNNLANTPCPPLASTVVTAPLPDTFSVAITGTQTAGTSFAVTITAKLPSGPTDTSYSGAKSVVFSGPANSPNGTAPTYPATVTFTNGAGTATITLFNAAPSTTLTATAGAITGTSTAFQVKPAAVPLAFTTCPPAQHGRGQVATGQTVTRGNDPYGNPDPNKASAISVALSANQSERGRRRRSRSPPARRRAAPAATRIHPSAP